MTKAEAIAEFDPNGVGAGGTLFGLPFAPENAELVIIPVPWEVTVSYTAGTANGPAAILKASTQVDLYQKDIADAWKYGVAMLPIPEHIRELSDAHREIAAAYIGRLEDGTLTEESDEAKLILAKVDGACREMIHWVKNEASSWRKQGKSVALLGGDHSTPLGLITELAEGGKDFGILQIDAHADLRVAFEGFAYSHASIMYNALKIPQVSKLIQVGIRDFCEAEADMVRDSEGRIHTFYYQDLAAKQFQGQTWKQTCDEIIGVCPERVYISFDIDGLDPKLCPNTGTPVPGGFAFEEVNYLLTQLAASGKEIIGFDLNEVSPGPEADALETNDWDGNVGARMLYRLCNLMGVSKGKLELGGGY